MIALAHKRLGEGLSAVDISNLSREQVESGLEFGAFAVFQCPLKPESEPALGMLKVGQQASPSLATWRLCLRQPPLPGVPSCGLCACMGASRLRGSCRAWRAGARPAAGAAAAGPRLLMGTERA